MINIFSDHLCSMFEWLKNLFSSTTKEIEDPMKYLIVGLGNMHPDYDGTRHNVGFDVLDLLAEQLEVKFNHEQLGDVAVAKFKGRTLILLKPSTYMNRSGKAVKYWMQQKKILLENILVVVDDKNIPYEKIRLKSKGSDGGHNGLKDIHACLGTVEYNRLRFGIGSDFKTGRQVDFVLGKWDKKELDELNYLLKTATDAIKSFVSIGPKLTMDVFNK